MKESVQMKLIKPPISTISLLELFLAPCILLYFEFHALDRKIFFPVSGISHIYSYTVLATFFFLLFPSLTCHPVSGHISRGIATLSATSNKK